MKTAVRLIQCNPRLGDWEHNHKMHLEAIEHAVRDGKQIVMFPELSLTGYFLKDQAHEEALYKDAEELNSLREASKNISILAGFVERGRDGRIYNSMGFFEDGELIAVHRKVHLVTYGMFEDGRDFAPGSRFEPVRSKHGIFGVLTCEDMWHIGGAYLYFLDGVDALLVASASPGRGIATAGTAEGEPALASNRIWKTVQDHACLLFQTPVLYTNRVGFEDGVLFGGATRALDASAREIGYLDSLDDGHLDIELSRPLLERTRAITPLRRDERTEMFAAELSRRNKLDRGDPA
jgi:predicted amidohydrolase